MARKLLRDTRHGVIGGVAAGFGRYLDVDPVLVRLALILLVFADGFGLLAYLVCWAVVPRAAEDEFEAAGPSGPDALRETGERLAAGAGALAASTEHVQAAMGGLLVLIGALALADNLGWLHWPDWANFGTLWPVALIALGVGLVQKSRGRAADPR